MSDTGSPIKDAIVSMANHLALQQSTWGIKKIYQFPAYIDSGAIGKSLCLEILPETTMALSQMPNQYEWDIGLRITYISNKVNAEAAYQDILDVLSLMIVYLVSNPSPDSFGDIAAVGNLDAGDIATETGAGGLRTGSIDLTVKVSFDYS